MQVADGEGRGAAGGGAAVAGISRRPGNAGRGRCAVIRLQHDPGRLMVQPPRVVFPTTAPARRLYGDYLPGWLRSPTQTFATRTATFDGWLCCGVLGSWCLSA